MMKKNKLYTVNQWNKPVFMDNTLFPDGGALNPLSFKDAFSKQGMNKALNAGANAAIGIGANLVGGLAGNAISGGLESGAGSAISNIGGQLGSAVSAVNPIAGAAIGVGSQLLGGLTNRMFGSKLNQEKIAEVNADNARINQNASIIAGSNTTDDLMNNASQIYMGKGFSQGDIGEDGWFSSKASDEYERLKAQQETAQEAMTNSIVFAQNNVDNADDARIASNFIMAHGGLLNGNKKGNKMNRMTQMPIFMNNFALGGDVQMHGADYSVGEIYDVSEKEVKRLKSMGYEFEYVS